MLSCCQGAWKASLFCSESISINGQTQQKGLMLPFICRNPSPALELTLQGSGAAGMNTDAGAMFRLSTGRYLCAESRCLREPQCRRAASWLFPTQVHCQPGPDTRLLSPGTGVFGHMMECDCVSVPSVQEPDFAHRLKLPLPSLWPGVGSQKPWSSFPQGCLQDCSLWS